MSYNYELLIIGAGSGGLAAAKRAATYNISVAVVEKESLGGTCVNRGCIPKKLMVYAADFALQDQLATSYGWSECQRQINWSQFLSKVHHHIDKLNQSYRQTLKEAGIDLIRGKAMFVDAHTITVNDRQITANKIIIAVGGHPIVPNIPGKEHGITSREMFHLQELPKRLAIIGGGYIGVEFASMMHALGSEVTLMDVEESILPGFDQDIRMSVQKGLSQRGIRILTQTTAKEITKGSDGIQLSLSGDYQETLNADTVLIATSRAPNTKDLGLENTEVNVSEKGVIEVDEYSRTTQDHIFAIGDCTNRIPLTPVAIAEGQAVVDTAIGNQPQSVNYDSVPSAVFTRPEAATVGMTQSKAQEKFGESVRCYRTEFKPMLYSLSEQDEKAMIKLIAEGENQRIVGAQMVGEHAADIIQTLAVAIRQGVNKQELNATICIHPTIGEEVLTLE
jgi:glutathione reductase (NADPH)